MKRIIILLIGFILITSCDSNKKRSEEIVKEFLEAAYKQNVEQMGKLYPDYLILDKTDERKDPSKIRIDSISKYDFSPKQRANSIQKYKKVFGTELELKEGEIRALYCSDGKKTLYI